MVMADTVTISVLPVPLALVRIPRHRLHSLFHPILRHILHPNPTFFNLTANEIELSLFVHYDHVHDFDTIVRADRERARPDPVEISYEPWSVLQIDAHSDQLDTAGARVNELSAPLAAAGISILYQSSYMSDFILVKKARLHEALALFEVAGFGLYTSHLPDSPSMSFPSPVLSSQSPSNADYYYYHYQSIGDFASNAFSPTVLTRTQSAVVATHPSTSTPSSPDGLVKYPSPTSPDDVHILDPDLACVGLSDEFGMDHWGLKIVKLFAFPDLVPSTSTAGHQKSSRNAKIQKWKKDTSELGLHVVGDQEHKVGEGVEGKEENNDDGYFSHSPRTPESSATPILIPPPSQSNQKVDGELAPSLSSINTQTRDSQTTSDIPSNIGLKTRISYSQTHSSLQVPFFSFTRTQEGSSLTADVRTLAALFPPEERHLLIYCSDVDLDYFEPGAEDVHENGYERNKSVEAEGNGVVRVEGHVDDEVDQKSTEEDDDDGGGGGAEDGTLKCLQIDLRRFGLDKHGLVNKFSRVLQENGVNHMYSSTFKTANLLVNKRHAIMAQALLRAC